MSTGSCYLRRMCILHFQYDDESERNRQILTEHSQEVRPFLFPLTVGKYNFYLLRMYKVFLLRICCVFYDSQGQT